VDNQETRNIGGTGLGLALVKEIVEAHRGRVAVKSTPGYGSTFSFALPVAKQIADAEPSKTLVPDGAAEVLLVEDDEAFATLLREHLTSAGLSVATTPYGEHALELARRAPPRLALVDIHLAGKMDGWDVLMTMRSEEVLRTVPVLIISESATVNVRGLALGGAEYLLKPFSSESLLETVRRRLPNLAGKSVLVVDDDPLFRRQVVECLTPKEGVRVEEAADGHEALIQMEAHWPDLLVLDLLMPGMDGFEVLKALREDRRALNLPIVVVTGKSLLPSEKAYIQRKLATLVRKRDASLEHFAQVVGQVLQVEPEDSMTG